MSQAPTDHGPLTVVLDRHRRVLLGVVFVSSGVNEVAMATLAPVAGRSGTSSWPPASSWVGCGALSGRSTASSPWPRCWADRVDGLAQRSYLLLFWVGLLALFGGFSQIILALTIHHASHQAATALGDTSPG